MTTWRSLTGQKSSPDGLTRAQWHGYSQLDAFKRDFFLWLLGGWSEKVILIKVESHAFLYSHWISQWNGWRASWDWCWLNILWAQLSPTNMAPYNFALKRPHCRLKWRKTNLMFPFPILELPIIRFYARLFELTSYDHPNLGTLCSKYYCDHSSW